MRYVTFVHGIGNKPQPLHLLKLWKAALSSEGGIDLDAAGVIMQMVYWADVLHGAPLADAPPEDKLVEADGEADDYQGGTVPLPTDLSEAEFTAMLAAKVGAAMAAELLASPANKVESLLEVPLPDWLKKRLMKSFLRDAHHYLYDVEHAPRPGEKYRVRQEIRRRFVEAVSRVPQGATHLVVGHSLGSVIAYDCLKNVSDCVAIDHLVTLGSPLGLSEVQGRLGPGYSRENGFPAAKLTGSWENLADRFDPVCGLDVKLAADYQDGGMERVLDGTVTNNGGRHAIGQYLQRAKVRSAMSKALSI